MILKSFNVFGKRYKIIQKASPEYNGEEVDGLCDSLAKELVIRRGLNTKEKLETFFHELFHAALRETGVSPVLSPAIEEVIVENLSKIAAEYVLALVDKENKKVAKQSSS